MYGTDPVHDLLFRFTEILSLVGGGGSDEGEERHPSHKSLVSGFLQLPFLVKKAAGD